MIDNTKLITPHLLFDDPDRFYSVMVIRRKKENPHLPQKQRSIASAFVGSRGELLKRLPELMTIADAVNGRIYISTERKSFQNVALETVIDITRAGMNGVPNKAHRSYYSCVGKDKGCDKRVMIDFDTRDESIIDTFVQPLLKHYLFCVDTPNGYHFVFENFDKRIFAKVKNELINDGTIETNDVEIKTNEMVLLYAPDIEQKPKFERSYNMYAMINDLYCDYKNGFMSEEKAHEWCAQLLSECSDMEEKDYLRNRIKKLFKFKPNAFINW